MGGMSWGRREGIEDVSKDDTDSGAPFLSGFFFFGGMRVRGGRCYMLKTARALTLEGLDFVTIHHRHTQAHTGVDKGNTGV